MHKMHIYSSLSGCLPESYFKLLGSGVTYSPPPPILAYAVSDTLSISP